MQFGGIIANYEPHIHISLWDVNKQYQGGHMEDGCSVLTLSEISIKRLSSLRLTRRVWDDIGPAPAHLPFTNWYAAVTTGSHAADIETAV